MSDPKKQVTFYAFILAIVSCVGLLSAYVSPDRHAPRAPSLGAAETYAVLAGTIVTNTGTTKITGDVGVSSPGRAVVGFPPGVVVGGAMHIGDPSAQRAQADARRAYAALARRKCTRALTGQDLGRKTLLPGVYCFGGSARLNGQLVLDAQSNVHAVWVFQVARMLTTAPNSSVVMDHGGRAGNVFWQVGNAAMFDTSTAFAGNVLAYTSIRMKANSSVSGRALARASVTLVKSNVSNVITVVPPEMQPKN